MTFTLCLAAALAATPLPQICQVSPPFSGPAWAGSDRELAAILTGGAPSAERAVAALALGRYVFSSYDARTALLERMADEREDEVVRRACAKSLSWGGHDARVPTALLALSADGAPEGLRALAFKAMYRMGNRAEVAAAFEAALSGWSPPPPEARRGAAWGAFLTARRAEVRAALVAVFERESDEDLRLEALKSLYGSLNLSDIRRLYLDAAQDARLPSALRSAAALGLVRRAGDSDVHRSLAGLAERDRDDAVRAAARRALTGYVGEDVAAFFHLDAVMPGGMRDPLAGE